MGQPDPDPTSGASTTPGSRSTDDRRGGVDVFDSLLVDQPIRDGATEAACDLLREWIAERDDPDARTLVPVDGVSLVSLFLDRGTDDDPDRLRWYLEVVDDDTPAWAEPDATLRARSPLFGAGLDELVDGATVHRDGTDGHQLLVHATHPRRQERYADSVGRSLVAPVAGEELPIPVVLVRVPLKPGLPSRLVAAVTRVGNRVKRFGPLREWLSRQTQTLEAEAMYTESLLFEPVGGRLVLHYYMETESMERLYDAYEGSANLDVRFSDWVMRRVFEEPDRIVEYPPESDDELLAHAVDPTRP